jgi:hypothetical protein
VPDPFKLATDALKIYAGQRIQDAYIYHGMYYFINDVRQIPRGAWGQMRWSDRWDHDWQAACGYRMDEARTSRDQMSIIGGHLLQILANYTRTDQAAALNINLVNRDTRPYLDDVTHGRHVPTAHPGGLAPDPQFATPTGPFGGEFFAASSVAFPAANDKLNQLRTERLPGSQWWIGPDGGGETFSNGEDDDLTDFVTRYHSQMREIDGVIAQNDPGAPLPFQDIIRPAWLSAPTIVANHADLIYSVRNTYNERCTDWKSDDKAMALYWTGVGAKTYFNHSGVTQDYLTQASGQANWLASEGGKAARLLRQLRTTYASIGYRYIRRMLDELAEYESVATSVISRLTDCTSPAGAAKALIGTIGDLNSELLAQERRTNDAAQDVLQVESIVDTGAPDFNSRGHDAVPFPAAGADPIGVWSDSSRWRQARLT